MTSAAGGTAGPSWAGETVGGLRRRLAVLQEERRELEDRIAEVSAAIDRLDGAAATPTATSAPSAPSAAGPAAAGGAARVPARGWAALSTARREAVLSEHELLARTWARTYAAGEPVEGTAAQEVARRHRDWLASALDAPAGVEDVLAARALLAADPDAAREYERHGDGVAAYVRDALAELAARS